MDVLDGETGIVVVVWDAHAGTAPDQNQRRESTNAQRVGEIDLILQGLLALGACEESFESRDVESELAGKLCQSLGE